MLLIFFATVGTSRAQYELDPLDFGYVPVGTTNTLGTYYWNGGAWNGTQSVMTVDTFIGPNAAYFSKSPNFTGETLYYGSSYPYTMSFAPPVAGFSSAIYTNFVTPYPPFGAAFGIVRGIGIPAARPATGPIVPELQPLQDAMTNYLVAHQFEAGTIALKHDSKLVLREGYGWRDTNFTTVIHPDNLFRLASVSKMLTASAIQKLVDQGKISTSMTVYDYLGIQPWGGTLGDNRITNITVQMLLDHSGGWDRNVSPVGDPPFDIIQLSTEMGLDYPAGPTNMISWMFSKPLDFEPGTTNAYSNFGYCILGRVIEKASGKHYVDYVQQDLLGNAGITNSIGFLNVVQSHSRPRDLAPWEIWYGDKFDLYQSAVDFPTNIQVRFIDGGGYYECYDSFGGMSASAIGLCNYLTKYWEGGDQRIPGENYGWSYIFYGSLPGATSVLLQEITQSPTATNGLEFAALFNQRDDDPNDNEEADVAIENAAGTITSWPANGGGMIQWSNAAVTVFRTSPSITVNLARSGASTLPVKVSYTTYGLSATTSDFVTNSGIIAFAAGQTNQPVTITLHNNPANTNSRQFTLELISASGGAWLGDKLTSMITILSPPQFVGHPARLPGGGLISAINAGSNEVLTVQYSTNLTKWQSLETVTNTTGSITITDPGAQTRPATFYRLAAP